MNAVEKNFTILKDCEMKAYAQEIRRNLHVGQALENRMLVEVFALVRETVRRIIGLRYFDIQMIGGLILHEGKIVEMRPGEGKTIVAILPAVLNSFYTQNVHVITISDYFVRRDAGYVGRVYKALGLTVGLIEQKMSRRIRKKNYFCDIVYTTHNQIAFDYLRDSLALRFAELVQRPFSYGILDEVDVMLIDNVLDPVILGGGGKAANKSTSSSPYPSKSSTTNIRAYKESRESAGPVEYYFATKVVRMLRRNIHYVVDRQSGTVNLLPEGVSTCQDVFQTEDLYDLDQPWIYYLINSLRAKELYYRDVEYLVRHKRIAIIDSKSGKLAFGRRMTDGVHQALEAKEGLAVAPDKLPVATIGYSALFLSYNKLAGMSGTVHSEKIELAGIYNLEVIALPPNRPILRTDLSDVLYKNQYSKFRAIAKECLKMGVIGRPVLVCASSVQTSEILDAMFRSCRLTCKLLNARPESIVNESSIIANMGRPNALTISTALITRGVDIVLGGAKVQPKILIPLSFFQNFRRFGNFLLLGFKNHKVHFVRHRHFSKNLSNISLKRRFAPTFQNVTSPQLGSLNELVIELGGLHIIGSSRFESLRIDKQLRGRSGRQGEPGSSRFFTSLDDPLMDIFGENQRRRLRFFAEKLLELNGTIPLHTQLVTRFFSTLQYRITLRGFGRRLKFLSYAEPLDGIRKTFYEERKNILTTISIREFMYECSERCMLDLYIHSVSLPKNWIDLGPKIVAKTTRDFQTFNKIFSKKKNFNYPVFAPGYTRIDRLPLYIKSELKNYELKLVNSSLVNNIWRLFILNHMDSAWSRQLKKVSDLKTLVEYRTYGKRVPLTEYKREVYVVFSVLLAKLRQHTARYFLTSKILFTEKNKLIPNKFRDTQNLRPSL